MFSGGHFYVTCRESMVALHFPFEQYNLEFPVRSTEYKVENMEESRKANLPQKA